MALFDAWLIQDDIGDAIGDQDDLGHEAQTDQRTDAYEQRLDIQVVCNS
jgi:hypothetical protein|tara:strand:+ start:1565 stop:1711 length:147 start_codon:yes stop_codon:yes gene_type:complete